MEKTLDILEHAKENKESIYLKCKAVIIKNGTETFLILVDNNKGVCKTYKETSFDNFKLIESCNSLSENFSEIKKIMDNIVNKQYLINKVKRLTKSVGVNNGNRIKNQLYKRLLKSFKPFKYRENSIITDEELLNNSLEQILYDKDVIINNKNEKDRLKD